MLWHTPGTGCPCQGWGDSPVPRPSGSSASPGFSSSTMGSECSLRTSLRSTDNISASPCGPRQLPVPLEQPCREVTALVVMLVTLPGGWGTGLAPACWDLTSLLRGGVTGMS